MDTQRGEGCQKNWDIGNDIYTILILHIKQITSDNLGFPGDANGKEPARQCGRCKRHAFDPQVGKISWRRVWQPTPVFLPGEFHRQRRLAGYSLQGCKELDTTAATQHSTVGTYCIARELCSVFCGDLNGKGIRRRRNVCISVTD